MAHLAEDLDDLRTQFSPCNSDVRYKHILAFPFMLRYSTSIKNSNTISSLKGKIRITGDYNSPKVLFW